MKFIKEFRVKRTWLSAHYLPNGEMAEDLALKHGKDVELPH